MQRPNVTVETGAYVRQLVLSGERARGVRYVRNGADRVASAAREVILACGTVRTPQLLMVSGIGPAGHLRRHHIVRRGAPLAVPGGT
jgi:choline dehydrogenase